MKPNYFIFVRRHVNNADIIHVHPCHCLLCEFVALFAKLGGWVQKLLKVELA